MTQYVIIEGPSLLDLIFSFARGHRNRPQTVLFTIRPIDDPDPQLLKGGAAWAMGAALEVQVTGLNWDGDLESANEIRIQSFSPEKEGVHRAPPRGKFEINYSLKKRKGTMRCLASTPSEA